MSSIFRITTLQQTNTMIGFIADNSNKYNDLLQEASSGIKVNEASDDPVAANKILDYTSQIKTLEGYLSNIDSAQCELNTADAVLDSLNELVNKVKDYATQAANDTYTQEDLDSIKSSVDSIIDSIISYSNTTYNGKYVFSGTATSTETYSYTTDVNGNYTSITYNGTDNDYERYTTISEGTTVPVNARGSDVFGYYNSAADNSGLFGDLVTLSNALENGDTATIGTCMDGLNDDLDTIISVQTELASVYNQMDMTHDSIEDTIINFTEYRSKLQDADLSETLVELEATKVALEASYTLTSEVLSMNLLKYL